MDRTVWDISERLYRDTYPNIPSGKLGHDALLKIRKIFEPYCDLQGPHPLRGRFLVASEDSCLWLCHYARKLDAFIQIPGHKAVFRKLGSESRF